MSVLCPESSHGNNRVVDTLPHHRNKTARINDGRISEQSSKSCVNKVPSIQEGEGKNRSGFDVVIVLCDDGEVSSITCARREHDAEGGI